MKWFHRILIVILSLLASQAVFAQSLEIESFDVSNYPTIRAYVIGTDAGGDTLRDYNSNSEFTVVDGGKTRPVTNVYCEKRKRRFSLILTIDRTGSMNDPVDPNDPNSPIRKVVAENAAKALIDALPANRSECAITSFSFTDTQGSKLEHDFSNDKESLKKIFNNITWNGATDFNKAFFGTKFGAPGALQMAAQAKWTPIILLLTDGEHTKSEGVFRAGRVKFVADSLGAVIYVVTLGLAVPDNLKSITTANPLRYFSDVSGNNLEDIFQRILREAQLEGTPIPCHIEWQSDCDGGDVEITLNRFGGITATDSYDATAVQPHMEIAQRDYYFENIPVGSSKDQKVTICAEKNYIDFNGNGYTSDDGQYSIIDWDGSPTPPAKLDSGKCIEVTVRFTPADTACTEPDFSFDASACTGLDLNLRGGYVYALPVNMGSSTLGNQKLDTVQKFCNYTCEDITITGIDFRKSGDYKDFEVLSPSFPVDLPSGSCLEIVFGFTPGDTLPRSATYIVKTSVGDKEAEIFGTGSGQAQISVADSYDFEAIDCNQTEKCTPVEISNTGALDLVVTSIDFSGPDFSLNPDETPFTIRPGGNRTVNVCFSSTNTASQNITMTINSNAANDDKKEISLTGIWNEYAFAPAETTIDLGFVCPGESVTKTLTLNNTGSVDVDVAGTVGGGFTLPTSNWTLPNGGNQTINIDFSSNTEGAFTDTLTLTNAKCGTTQEVVLTGEVAEPKITGTPAPMQATVGFYDTQTFNITNESSRPATFDLSTGDPQFEIDTPNPPTGIALGANASMPVTIIFRPTSASPVTSQLLISGQPCDFRDSIRLVGGANVATADLTVGQYSGLTGQTITIPVELNNKSQFVESGTTTIDYELSFDPDLLESLPPDIAVNGVLPITMPTGGANDEAYDIEFLVLGGNGKISTPLTLSSISPNGTVVISDSPGTFTLTVASADISINKNLSAAPGDKLEIPIMQNNGTNISEFHEGITTELRFNYTLLEPLFTPASSNIDRATGERTITIDNLPINNSSGSVTLESYPFRAMLGNAESTDIFIQNTASKTGEIIFTIEDGRFSLLNVCKNADGSIVRLFDPTGRTILASPSPNPITGVADLEVELREKGTAKIWLSDMSGRKVLEVANGNFTAGQHTFQINTNELKSGAYMIILETEFRTFSTRMEVIK